MAQLLGNNSFTESALQETLNNFVRTHVNGDAAGVYTMDSRLYSDGQATVINMQDSWSHDNLKKGLLGFHDGALKEWMTELNMRKNDIESQEAHIAVTKKYLDDSAQFLRDRASNRNILELKQRDLQESQIKIEKLRGEQATYNRKIKMLQDPVELAKAYSRELRKSTFGTVPDPESLLEAANSSDVGLRNKALGLAIQGNTEPLKAAFAKQSLNERLESSINIAKILDYKNIGLNSLCQAYLNEIPVSQRLAFADAIKQDYGAFLIAGNTYVAHAQTLSDPLKRMQMASKGLDYLSRRIY